jgi:hypothetical protein
MEWSPMTRREELFSLVIPANAGIHLDFRSCLKVEGKIKMDPSVRWDDEQFRRKLFEWNLAHA